MTNADLLLQNCTVLRKGKPEQSNVSVKNGLIESISSEAVQAKKTVDCLGKLVMPAGIDVHVHFRVPGATQKEDWKTGSRAALAGGIATVLDMPNNKPAAITGKVLAFKRKTAARDSLCNYGFHFGATPETIGTIAKLVHVNSVKLYMGASTGNLLFGSGAKLKQLFYASKQNNLVVCVHAEDEQLIVENSNRFMKKTDPLIHGMVRSREAEILAVEKALIAQEETGNRLHFCHISCRDSIEMIAEAKEGGRKISCEVTPHHLFLEEKSIEKLRNFGKVNPPLRQQNDVNALWKGIADKTVDVVASDHAPHLPLEKKKSYWSAPSGIPGIETMLPLLFNAASSGRLSLERVNELVCGNPAKIFGIKGKGFLEKGMDADLIVVDLNRKKHVKNEELFTKCGWSPWNGETFKGVVEKTIVRGNIVFDNALFASDFRGKEVF